MSLDELFTLPFDEYLQARTDFFNERKHLLSGSSLDQRVYLALCRANWTRDYYLSKLIIEQSKDATA